MPHPLVTDDLLLIARAAWRGKSRELLPANEKGGELLRIPPLDEYARHWHEPMRAALSAVLETIIPDPESLAVSQYEVEPNSGHYVTIGDKAAGGILRILERKAALNASRKAEELREQDKTAWRGNDA